MAWNRQVQHILASNFAARCVVWDLRKNEPIIKISDSMSQVSLDVCQFYVTISDIPSSLTFRGFAVLDMLELMEMTEQIVE